MSYGEQYPNIPEQALDLSTTSSQPVKYTANMEQNANVIDLHPYHQSQNNDIEDKSVNESEFISVSVKCEPLSDDDDDDDDDVKHNPVASDEKMLNTSETDVMATIKEEPSIPEVKVEPLEFCQVSMQDNLTYKMSDSEDDGKETAKANFTSEHGKELITVTNETVEESWMPKVEEMVDGDGEQEKPLEANDIPFAHNENEKLETRRILNDLKLHSGPSNSSEYGSIIQAAINSPQKVFPCSFCEKAFGSKTEVIRHIRVHTGERPYSCGDCGKSFSQKGTLEEHTRSHSTEKTFCCDECGKCYSHRTTLAFHKRIHADRNPITCQQCDRSFFRKRDFIRHTKLHADAGPFTCDQCSKSFSKESFLKLHKKVHEIFFTCNVCGERMTNQRTLAAHRRTHSTNVLNILCPLCGKLFHRKTHLDRHMKRHSEKPFSCENCGRLFAQRNELERHSKVHSGDGPFPCHECGKTFAVKKYLLRHSSVHVEKIPLVCPYCGMSFGDKSSFIHHEKMHLPNGLVLVG